MDEDYIDTVFPRFWRGVTKNHVEVQEEFRLFSFDTETMCGKVFASGFYDGHTFKMLHGLEEDHLSFILDNIMALTGKGHKSFVGGGHYILFDLAVLLWPILNPRNDTRDRAPKVSCFTHLKTRIEFEIIWGKPCFCKLRRGKRTITIIDTWAFFTMSLAKALKMIGSSVSKLAHPEGLGHRVIPPLEVEPYLKEDCRGAYALLEFIEELHRKYKTRLCYSLPMMSARIFRHFFMARDFPKPSGPLMQAALLSYHGGKNTFVAKVGWHKDCWDLDINSAYPEAMRQLPDFEHGSWRAYEGLDSVRFHPHGIYQVWGVSEYCPWPIIYTHDFHAAYGVVRGLWTTGYELLEAVDSGEFKLTMVMGWGFHENARAGEPAFRKFVDHFYGLRSSTKDSSWRTMYKLILNSLYGKFVSRIDIELEDGTIAHEAGSCFDPTIASLITGFVRARLHRLEHKYKALHTATDGFITQRKPDPRDCGEALGKLKQETFGPILILRNKLYIHYDKLTKKMAKTGLHGFEGTADELMKLYKLSRKVYKNKHLTRWAEAWHTGIPPGVEITRDKELKVSDLETEVKGLEEAFT